MVNARHLFSKLLPHFKVLVAQLCPILCNPMVYSPSGSSVHRILQSRIVEWVTIPFSRVSSNPRIKPRSLALQAYSLHVSHQGSPQRNRSILCWLEIGPGLPCGRQEFYHWTSHFKVQVLTLHLTVNSINAGGTYGLVVSSGRLLEMHNLQHHSKILNWNQHFIKIPRWLLSKSDPY